MIALRTKLVEIASGCDLNVLFEEWDSDGNGALDKAEVRGAVASLIGYESSDDHLNLDIDAIFDSIDLDASGWIDREELITALSTPPVQVRPAMHDSSMLAREFSANAVADLALLPANHDQIVALGGVTPIVTLLCHGSNRGKQYSSAALARLSHGHDETAAAIAEAGAIPPLVALLGGEFGDGSQEEGAHALYALADNEANRQYITQAGGIVPLVELLGSTNTRAREHAEGALVRLSIDPANRVAIIKKLVSMLDEQVGQEQAAAALANLAKDSSDNRKSIVSAGGVAPLLSLLKDTMPMRCKENAVSAIKALAYRSKEIQGALASAGGIPLVANVLINSTSNAKDHWCLLQSEARDRS